MAYSPSTFITSYNSTDVAIRFRDTAGTIKQSVSVGKIQKIATEDKVLWVILQNNKRIILDFATSTDAKTAEVNLNATIVALLPNYRNIGGAISTVAVPQTIVSTTLTNYKSLRLSNSLVPLQWYLLSDSLNTFGIGTSYQVLAMTNDDASPMGIVPATGAKFTINVIDNILVRYELPSSNVMALNASFITPTTSSYLYAANRSFITTTNCNRISALNNATVSATDSSYIIAQNNADITLNGALRCTFDGITGDYSAFTLSDIIVNKTNSIGKVGEEIMSPDDNETLQAYINTTIQHTPVLTSDIVKRLDNPFVEANAEFTIYVNSDISTYSLSIIDANDLLLLEITNLYVDSYVTFVFDKATGLFKVAPETLKTHSEVLTVATDDQTAFVMNIAPRYPETARLYVNGVKAQYGVLNDFSIVNKTLTWTNNSFNLQTSDYLEIFYI